MTDLSVLDAAGRRRSPATLPGYHAGRPPRNKGLRYPADPPTVEEIVAVMRHAADDRHGRRLRAMIVVLWRAGLRIQEAIALAEHDLDHRRGSLLVRNGKGGRRREVGMDEWGWEQLRPWLGARAELPGGPLFCTIDGPPAGGRGQAPPCAASSGASPPKRVSGAGSRRISCATRTLSRSPMRAYRSSSSSGGSATAISGSPRSTSRASTTPRLSTPSTFAARPWSPPAPRSDSDARDEPLSAQTASERALRTYSRPCTHH